MPTNLAIDDDLLREALKVGAIALATEGDHIMAADLVTQSARRGVALSTPDALIAAQAINRRARLFTTDADFQDRARVTTVRLV
jgi:predicted nucleic acid-binding protein